MNAKQHFEKSQAQHEEMSLRHGRLAKICHGDGRHEEGDEHEGLNRAHAAYAAHYKAMAADVASKADSGGNLVKKDSDLRDMVTKLVGEIIGNTVRPTEVRGTIPNAFGVTLVPRHGSPQQPVKPVVDAQFEKLFAVEHVDETSVVAL